MGIVWLQVHAIFFIYRNALFSYRMLGYHHAWCCKDDLEFSFIFKYGFSFGFRGTLFLGTSWSCNYIELIILENIVWHTLICSELQAGIGTFIACYVHGIDLLIKGQNSNGFKGIVRIEVTHIRSWHMTSTYGGLRTLCTSIKWGVANLIRERNIWDTGGVASLLLRIALYGFASKARS